jgi:hypothetical protein
MLSDPEAQWHENRFARTIKIRQRRRVVIHHVGIYREVVEAKSTILVGPSITADIQDQPGADPCG